MRFPTGAKISGRQCYEIRVTFVGFYLTCTIDSVVVVDCARVCGGGLLGPRGRKRPPTHTPGPHGPSLGLLYTAIRGRGCGSGSGLTVRAGPHEQRGHRVHYRPMSREGNAPGPWCPRLPQGPCHGWGCSSPSLRSLHLDKLRRSQRQTDRNVPERPGHRTPLRSCFLRRAPGGRDVLEGGGGGAGGGV